MVILAILSPMGKDRLPPDSIIDIPTFARLSQLESLIVVECSFFWLGQSCGVVVESFAACLQFGTMALQANRL